MNGDFRVLVCGGRDFEERYPNGEMWLSYELNRINRMKRIGRIIHGFARGADRLARAWAIRNFIPETGFVAEWDRYGNFAGPMRNQLMLDEGRPHLVVAFPGDRGTRDMIRRATEAGVAVFQP